MGYLISTTDWEQLVELAKTAARDTIKGRTVITVEEIPDYKRHVRYVTLTSPAASQNLVVPGTGISYMGSIKYGDNYVQIWQDARHVEIDYYTDQADQKEGGGTYKADLISETIRRMAELEDTVIFDGFKNLAGAYVGGATGIYGAAANTQAATAAWSASTADIHADIKNAFAKLKEDYIDCREMYLCVPSSKIAHLRAATPLGLSVFENIQKSFPEIKGYVDTFTLTYPVLYAKQPLYGKFFTAENFKVWPAHPVSAIKNQILITNTYGIVVKETNAACTITGA